MEIRILRAALVSAALVLAFPVFAESESPFERENLLGDLGGARQAMEDAGVDLEQV